MVGNRKYSSRDYQNTSQSRHNTRPTYEEYDREDDRTPGDDSALNRFSPDPYQKALLKLVNQIEDIYKMDKEVKVKKTDKIKNLPVGSVHEYIIGTVTHVPSNIRRSRNIEVSGLMGSVLYLSHMMRFRKVAKVDFRDHPGIRQVVGILSRFKNIDTCQYEKKNYINAILESLEMYESVSLMRINVKLSYKLLRLFYLMVIYDNLADASAIADLILYQVKLSIDNIVQKRGGNMYSRSDYNASRMDNSFMGGNMYDPYTGGDTGFEDRPSQTYQPRRKVQPNTEPTKDSDEFIDDDEVLRDDAEEVKTAETNNNNRNRTESTNPTNTNRRTRRKVPEDPKKNNNNDKQQKNNKNNNTGQQSETKKREENNNSRRTSEATQPNPQNKNTNKRNRGKGGSKIDLSEINQFHDDFEDTVENKPKPKEKNTGHKTSEGLEKVDIFGTSKKDDDLEVGQTKYANPRNNNQSGKRKASTSGRQRTKNTKVDNIESNDLEPLDIEVKYNDPRKKNKSNRRVR